jgi:regulator of cell morphogenesis and NO signaling
MTHGGTLTGAPTTVAQLLRTFPAAACVLERHKIDFLCRGSLTLEQACINAGVTLPNLIDEIDEANRTVRLDWSNLPAPALCDAIEARFHLPLVDELPRMQAIAERLLLVHADTDGEVLHAVAHTLDQIVGDIVPHMASEEDEVFPLIREGRSREAVAFIRATQREHDTLSSLLSLLRRQTNGFTPPPHAGAQWSAFYKGLADLESETREHIRMEDDVLADVLTAVERE